MALKCAVDFCRRHGRWHLLVLVLVDAFFDGLEIELLEHVDGNRRETLVLLLHAQFNHRSDQLDDLCGELDDTLGRLRFHVLEFVEKVLLEDLVRVSVQEAAVVMEEQATFGEKRPMERVEVSVRKKLTIFVQE